MPRFPPLHLHRAFHIHPLLPYLLRATRTLDSAINELRWLRSSLPSPSLSPSTTTTHSQNLRARNRLKSLCIARSRGKPLQYILGTQPFGELEIVCRRGVLIPRPETETWTHHLASLLLSPASSPLERDGGDQRGQADGKGRRLRVLDLCTGSGCIPLLLYSLLATTFEGIEIRGVDISPKAVGLARRNVEFNISKGLLPASARAQVRFEVGDVFDDDVGVGVGRGGLMGEGKGVGEGEYDVVVANPPYISRRGWERDTARSVRGYEPKSALVPPRTSTSTSPSTTEVEDGDAFYPRIIEIADRVKAKVLAMEVGGIAQARRVVGMLERGGKWKGREIWRDGMTIGSNALEEEGTRKGDKIEEGGLVVRGEGEGRVVCAWR
ncbi:MAG: hypothetical protein Q9220_006899 [cf. Caloplaca sp. 1 TL-2023]